MALAFTESIGDCCKYRGDHMKTFAFVLGMFLLSAAGVRARTLHVPDDFAAIQAAIDASGRNDAVEVAPGVYSECLTLKNGTRLVAKGVTLDARSCDVAVLLPSA